MHRTQEIAVDGHLGIRARKALGRVYTAHPTNFECFYLGILLPTVICLTYFEYLSTVNEEVCPTFRESYLKRGLLEDDSNWDATMFEAAANKSSKKLRILFAIIVVNCGVADTLNLWNTHNDSISEDICLQAQMMLCAANVEFTPVIFNKVLILIVSKVLEMIGKRIQDIDLPTADKNSTKITAEMIKEASYRIE